MGDGWIAQAVIPGRGDWERLVGGPVFRSPLGIRCSPLSHREFFLDWMVRRGSGFPWCGQGGQGREERGPTVLLARRLPPPSPATDFASAGFQTTWVNIFPVSPDRLA